MADIFLKLWISTAWVNKYGKEESELIKYSCSNIIYLLAKDDYTLEEISKLCGNQNSKSALITKEELKTLIRENTFVDIGKQFKVSDNTIRKWCKVFNLPTSR